MSPTILARAIRFRPLIEEGLAEGMHKNALQRHTGLSHQTLYNYIDALGLPRPKRKRQPVNEVRAADMIAMRKQGMSLAEIGAAHRLTRERVRQILTKEYPDAVFPAIRSKSRVCPGCGATFSPIHNAQRHCTKSCKHASTLTKNGWDRERAVNIMIMRDSGMGWAGIAARLTPELKADHFRSMLQHQIPVLFSKAEQARYFPPKYSPRFRTPDGALTTNP